MDTKKSLSVVLLSGGTGSRTSLSKPKQFISLQGKPIARHSFDLFLTLPIQELVVVCSEEYQSLFTTSLHQITFAPPGKERMFSLINGLNALTKPVDFILTHDAARPFIQKTDLMRLLQEGFSVGAATLASPVTSTIKRANKNQFVTETLPRELLWDIQTPQLIRHSLLKEGLETFVQKNCYATDEMSIAETLSHPVKIVEGSPLNFKITTMKDLLFAQTLFSEESLLI